MYGHSSPQPIVTTTSACSASSVVSSFGRAVREVDAQLAHHLDHLGCTRSPGRRARRTARVAAGGGALEQRLAHLRAAGVVQADEQDVAIRPSGLRLAAYELVGERARARPHDRADDVDPEVRPLARRPAPGPNERAGFIEAPVIGPPNSASRPTVPPIAIAAAAPTARVSVATAMITNIRNAVSTDLVAPARVPAPTLGTVAPRSAGPARPDRQQQQRAGDGTGELRARCRRPRRAREVPRQREARSSRAGLMCAPGEMPESRRSSP